MNSLIADKKFLEFFFKRIKPNPSERYRADFPYVSPCGLREMNYIRCDDLPIVFTHLIDQHGDIIEDIAKYGQSSESSTINNSPRDWTTFSEKLTYGGTGGLLTVPFQPNKLCMLPDSGRVYHAGLEKLGGVGLVKSSLALELSRFFVYDSPGADESMPPTKLVWRGRTWILDNSVLQCLRQINLVDD